MRTDRLGHYVAKSHFSIFFFQNRFITYRRKCWKISILIFYFLRNLLSYFSIIRCSVVEACTWLPFGLLAVLIPSVARIPTTTGSVNRSTKIHISVQTECSVQIALIGLQRWCKQTFKRSVKNGVRKCAVHNRSCMGQGRTKINPKE